MKLRIHQQTLRFRLGPKDIESLESNHVLSEALALSPDVTWRYGMRMVSELKRAETFCRHGEFEIRIPMLELRDWLESHEIEWTFEQSAPPLTVMIEKDLKPDRN